MLSILEAKRNIIKLTQEWHLWSERIAYSAEKILGSCEVYVFGSIIRGQATGASDVDILIISDQLPENGRDRGNLKAKIEEASNLPLYHPFEIHLATSIEAKESPAYRRAVSEGVRILKTH